MGLVYIYAYVMIARDKNFRSTIVRSINQPLIVPIGIYVLVALLGLLLTEQLSEGINEVKQIVNLLLVYLMVSVSIDAEQGEADRLKNTAGLFLSFLAGILVLDLIGLLTYFGFTGHARYSSIYAPVSILPQALCDVGVALVLYRFGSNFYIAFNGANGLVRDDIYFLGTVFLFDKK
jgi:uncharacterized membrane protein